MYGVLWCYTGICTNDLAFPARVSFRKFAKGGGGKMCESEFLGGQSHPSVCVSTRGVWGHASQEMFNFNLDSPRLLVVHSQTN